MITEAIVIGAVEAAVFWEDDDLHAVRLDPAADELIDCSSDVGWLLSTRAEKRRLPQVPQNLAELGEELRAWSQRHRALTMMISGMDAELAESTRTSCILAAEEGLRHPPSATFTRARLFGCPLPEEADLDRALCLAVEANAPRAAALYGDLSKAKPHLGTVRQLLEKELRYEFDDHFDPEKALRALIDSGIMADAVGATARRDTAALNGLIFRVANHPEIAEALPRAVHFLTRFIAAIRNIVGEWENSESSSFISEAVDEWKAEAGEDPLLEIVKEWKRTELALRSRKRREQRRRSLTADQALEQVEREKDFIVENMQKDRVGRAENAIHALIRSQRRHSTLAHVCLSLCDLAARATELRLFELAQRVYRAAKVANERDAVPFTGYAETLRQMGRLDEALAAYGEAKATFPHDGVPFNGYAETLRQMGRLDEALAAYGEAKATFSHDVVPFSGYAETLRQMGRLDEALAAYGEAKATFSREAYAATGYAETLRQMGRLDEALAAYGEAKAIFAHDVVPFTGYADTLRQMGRLDEALAAYGEAKATFSREAYAATGYAETLRQMGRLDEALAAYGEAKAIFTHDVVPVTGYAETLRQMGRLDEALAAYGEAKATFSHDVVPFTGYAETLRQMGRLDEALAAYGEAKATFSREAYAATGYAETLRQMGRLDEALAAYGEAKAALPHDVVPVTGYAETLRQMGRLDEALAAYGEAKATFSREAYAATGYAETLRQMGRLDEALAAYGEAKAIFAHDVVPFTGYADTLRQLGQIDSAEKEFRGVLGRFPTERVARNALACLLIDVGRISEARILVALEEPKTEHDWRDYHVAAMAFLKEENYEEADKRLSHGAHVARFQNVKNVFTAALAFAKLRRRQFQEVSALIERDNVLEFRLPAIAVVNAHAKAELGERERAEESLLGAERSRSAPVVRLSDFLRRRYALGPYSGRLPDKDEAAGLDALISEAEFDLALRIAA